MTHGVRARLRLVGWSFVLVLLALVGIGVAALLVLGTVLGPLRRQSRAALRWLADVHRLWAARVMDRPIPRPYNDQSSIWPDVRWLSVDLVAGIVLGGFGAICATVQLTGAYLVVRGFVRGPYLPSDNHNLYDQNLYDQSRVVLAVVVAAIACVAMWLATPSSMRAYVWLLARFLGPTQVSGLASRIDELTRSRADAVDAQSAEVRRIERDLHDGAQARLVSLGMSLGMAEKLFEADPPAARALLGDAKQSATRALSELRHLVRGIHPPILADRGLPGAVEALALANAIPVELTVDLSRRAPAPVESAVYFAITEIMANVAKHSGATTVWIRLGHGDGRLSAMVTDDGRGGATILPGGGLDGIERRLAAFDGTMSLASPCGGPTIVVMEVPCELACASS